MKKSGGKRGIFSPIKMSKISDEVYKQIVSMISSGQLKPGQRLPSEREMASDLGISRQSIREALYRAEIMGLIQVRQGEGSFVLSSVSESLTPPMAILLTEQAERVFEFLEIRKLIEGWCAEKAAVEANAEDLNNMQKILLRMEEIALDDQEWEKVDVEFHLSIAAATHNVIAMHIMDSLKDTFSAFFRFRHVITEANKKDLILQHHNDIFKAVSQRDASLAKRNIVDHLDFIGKKIKEDMENMQT